MVVAKAQISNISKDLDRFSQGGLGEPKLAFEFIDFDSNMSAQERRRIGESGDVDFDFDAPLKVEESLPDEEVTPAEPKLEPSMVSEWTAAKVGAVTLMSMGLVPGAAIRSAIELIPTVTTPGSLERAQKTFEEIMAVPQELLNTPEERQAMENLGKLFKPFQMAGEGWGIIAKGIDKGLQALGLEPTYLEPLLATYGEAAAVFALPGVIRGIKKSNTFRMLTDAERGLVVQNLAKAIKQNPNMTEGEIIKKYNNPQWRREALRDYVGVEERLVQGEVATNVANAAKAFEMEAAVIEGVPKVAGPVEKPTSYVFVSKKGHHYDKIGDKWYNNKGVEMTNKWVIAAAEKGKVVLSDEVPIEVVEPVGLPKPKKVQRFEEIKEDPIIESIVEVVPELEPVLPKPTEHPDYRTSPEETAIQAESFKGRPIDNHDTAIAVATNYVNQWLDGIEVDIDAVRDVLNREVQEINEPVLKKIAIDTAEWARNARREPASAFNDPLFYVKAQNEQVVRNLKDMGFTTDEINNFTEVEKFTAVDSPTILDARNRILQLGKEEKVVDPIVGMTEYEAVKMTMETSGKLSEFEDAQLRKELGPEGDDIITEGGPEYKPDIKIVNKVRPLTDEEAANRMAEILEGEDPEIKLTSGINPSDVVKGVKQLKDFITKKTISLTQPPDPHSSVKKEAKEQIFKRGGLLGVANYETAKFTNSIDQRTTEAQREVLPFLMEKTDIPDELGRPDLQKTLTSDKEYLEPIAEEVKVWFDQGFKKIKKHMPDLSVKQIEDYVTHLWEIPRNQRAGAVRWFQTQNRLLEKRFIPTYKEGIKRGYKPKTLDISEIIRVHDNISNRVIENSKYINELLGMKRDGVSLIHRGEDAPEGWVEVNFPALSRRVTLSKKQAGKKGQFTKEVKVYVHPELVRPLKVIFEERFDHPVISAYESINGVMKKSILSLSLFHHGALGETGVALIGPVKTGKIYLNPVKIYQALAKGEFDIYAKEDIAKDGILHGLQTGATADIPINKIQGYLNNLANLTKDTKMVGRVTSIMKDANSVWDQALWSYLHDTLKLYAYEGLVGDMNPKLDADMTTKTKREIAQFVNDTFGGQNWENLMMTPKEVQMMTWGLLSADWTMSTTRQALSPTGIGKVYEETAGVRRKMGRNFWARAAVYFGVGMNLLNVMYRNKDIKENPQYYEDKEYSFIDKTMFRNTVGKKTYLFKGRYKDGTERYVRWGKQFRDFAELIMDPTKKIGGKIAPLPQVISEWSAGIGITGFKNDDIYGKKGWAKTLGIVKSIIKAPLPISIKRFIQEDIEFKPLDVMMQSSKGMSRYTAMEYFKKGIVDGDEDVIRDAYVGALRNNLPAYSLFGGALGWVEAEIISSLAEDVEGIEDAEAKLESATNARDKKRYGVILKRLHKDRADKRMGLKLLKSALLRAEVYMETDEDRKPPRLPLFRTTGNKGSRSKRIEDINFD